MSHRNTSRKTYFLSGGIEARMTQQREVSRLLLIIPKMVVKKNEIIKRRMPYLLVNLQRKHVINHEVSVKVRIPYKYDRQGIIQEEVLEINVDDENFYGTVTVFPSFYLSKVTREINAKKMEKRDESAMNDMKKFKPHSASEYNLYTHTNISRPYRG